MVQAPSARISRVGLIWLCADCAASAAHRLAFVDEYARRSRGDGAEHREPAAVASIL